MIKPTLTTTMNTLWMLDIKDLKYIDASSIIQVNSCTIFSNVHQYVDLIQSEKKTT